MYTGLHVEAFSVLSDCNETLTFSMGFRKMCRCQVSLKSTQWDPSCSVRSDLKKVIVACSNFATARGNNEDIMN